MLLYIAGTFGTVDYYRLALKWGLKNRLVSYAYPTQLTNWLEITEDRKDNIIIDSGAFSAWNRGRKINIDKYIEYAHDAIIRCQKQNKWVKIVNLDVIPGSPGKTTSLNKNRTSINIGIINDAAKEGYKNLLILKKNGLTPIHVFHQGEDWKWLDRMLSHIDYIGISPANDVYHYAKEQWIEKVFEFLDKRGMLTKVSTHGFAVMGGGSLLRRYPWTSCDATSPIMQSAYGKIIYPKGGYENPDYSSNGFRLDVSERLTMKGRGDISPQVLSILEKDGYKYEDLQKRKIRFEICLRYYIGLEDWLDKKPPILKKRKGLGL